MNPLAPSCPRAEAAVAAALGLGPAQDRSPRDRSPSGSAADRAPDDRSPDDRHLASCAECAALRQGAELALADEEGAPRQPSPRVWEALEAALEAERCRAELRVVLGCAFCHDRLAKEEAVYCASCLTPHHSECFAAHGQCSALGCGETEVVRSRSGAPARSALGWGPAVAAALALAALGLGQVAWSNLRRWERPVALGPSGGASPQASAAASPAPDGLAPAARELDELRLELEWSEAGGVTIRLTPGGTRAADPQEPEAIWAWLGERLRERRARLGRAFPVVIEAGKAVPSRALARAVQECSDAELSELRFAAEPGRAQLTKQDLAKLRGLRGPGERERRDQHSYLRALEIVQSRDVSRYGYAKELLASVHPRSKVYRDARAYLEWIEADLEVRSATQAYRSGQPERAFQLLSDALARESLGQEGIDSIKERHTRWSRVTRAFARAQEHKAAGELAEARAEFLQVLKHEQDPDNDFYKQARAELRVLDTVELATAARTSERLREALRDRDWGQVHLWATQVERREAHDPQVIADLRREVARLNDEERILKRCERAFARERVDEFVNMGIQLRALAHWLPEDHPDREKARKLLKKLLPRIRAWRKASGGER